MSQDYLFKNRTNREIKAMCLKKEGYQIKKYSVRNQQLHPQYVEDESDYLRQQTGFGNTVYKSLYSVLYGVKTIEQSTGGDLCN